MQLTKADSVCIFDTTLRDGEQGAGSSMSAKDRLKIALMLDSAGIDIIEAGFPIASRGVYDSVYEIAAATKHARICALARGSYKDIDEAVSSLKPASDRSRIHVFIATDKDHMALKLRQKPERVLENIGNFVAYARRFVDDVEFSPEVATTSEPNFMYQAIDIAIQAGAKTINIPDTTGYALPHEYAQLIVGVVAHIKKYKRVVVSVHCHDDRGLATANALEGIRGGARQVECTINGLGERAGNTSLEEVVMALSLRPDVYGCRHGVDTTKLVALSKCVAEASGILVAPNKAFVGRNAFAHESGIHQAGVIASSSLYEICDPEVVGACRSLPIGKLSGKAGLKSVLEGMGYSELSPVLIERLYEQTMLLADQSGSLTESDLRAIVRGVKG